MIVIGAYPDSVGVQRQGLSLLRSLGEFVSRLVPNGVGLHILPFYPSSGDYGFAPDDWFKVRPDLGDWGDIEQLSAERRIIVDGVYNHVGVGHHFVRDFYAAPTTDGALYAYPSHAGVTGPSSPRGVPVLRRHSLQSGAWDLWQTFSTASVDIRLDNPDVQDEIRRHLEFLANRGVWAVRLDGCAYYGKSPCQEQFHHPAAQGYARAIAAMAKHAGLRVLAQLDCDPQGAAYFPRILGYDVPAVDYAYSALLVEALLTENAIPLMEHLRRTWQLPCEVVRPPRTHDGILLQSDLLPSASFDSIVSIAQRFALPIRISNGEYYELNSSFPHVCSLGVDGEGMWARLRMIAALTAFLPGWSYFYLPILLGDVPEDRYRGDADPRLVNRLPLDPGSINTFLASRDFNRMRLLLAYLFDLSHPSSDDHGLADPCVGLYGDSVICVNWPGAGARLLCNFSKNRSLRLEVLHLAEPAYSERANATELRPLGFGIWTSNVRPFHFDWS
ncbi:MAG: alpha-amylase family glycosyl hydrolase [Bryobacteraceae bacterium]